MDIKNIAYLNQPKMMVDIRFSAIPTDRKTAQEQVRRLIEFREYLKSQQWDIGYTAEREEFIRAVNKRITLICEVYYEH